MNTIYVDSRVSDERRRKLLYEGQLFTFSARPSSTAFTEFARQMIEEAFGPLDPLTAQYEMSVEKFVEIFAPLKPKFIHHPESKRLIKEMLADFGCDPETTYRYVPRLRAVTSDGYLTSGVGYAHHPHRDTWYSAPQCQINWWLPIYEIESESSMAFHRATGITRKKRFERFQLLRVEQFRTRQRGAAHHLRHAQAAEAGAADGTRSANPGH